VSVLDFILTVDECNENAKSIALKNYF